MTDPYEFKLASSPCLFSVKVEYEDIAFFRKLRPLSSLKITGWNVDSVLDHILDAHGTSLIKLELQSNSRNDLPTQSVRKRDLSKMSQRCSQLQYLDLTLDRTEGDPEEVALYRTLGLLPQLKDLSLTVRIAKTWDNIIEDNVSFDEVVEYAIDPRFDDEFDRKIPKAIFDDTDMCNGIARNRLINCALDAALGRDIFSAISEGKPKGSTPLERLSIEMTRVDYFGKVACLPVLVKVLRCLSRPLQITRSIRDDGYKDLLVEREEFSLDSFHDIPIEIPRWLQDIWRRVWPGKIADEWWNDWHSLPLAVTGSPR